MLTSAEAIATAKEMVAMAKEKAAVLHGDADAEAGAVSVLMAALAVAIVDLTPRAHWTALAVGINLALEQLPEMIPAAARYLWSTDG